MIANQTVKVITPKINAMQKNLVSRDSFDVKKQLKMKKSLWKRKQEKGKKGVVYLGHIPHGFYEDQIQAYFKQFGTVTNVSLPRSKSGKIKGYGFIEFKNAEVAQIAAETMNNYLMFNRVMKAKYIPPTEQKPNFFKAARKAKLNHQTASDRRQLHIKRNRKIKNRHLKIGLEAKCSARLLQKSKLLKSKLKNLDIEYDFQIDENNVDAIFKKRKELKDMKKKEMEGECPTEKEELDSEDEEELSTVGSGSESLSSVVESDVELQNNKEVRGKRLQNNKSSGHIKKSVLLNVKLSGQKKVLAKDLEESPMTNSPNLIASKNNRRKATVKRGESLKKDISEKMQPSKLQENSKPDQTKGTPLTFKSTSEKLKGSCSEVKEKSSNLKRKSLQSTKQTKEDYEGIVSKVEETSVQTKTPKLDSSKEHKEKSPIGAIKHSKTTPKFQIPKKNKTTPFNTPEKLSKVKTLLYQQSEAIPYSKTPTLKSEKRITTKQVKSTEVASPRSQTPRKVVMQVDINEKEINFKTPPNVVKRFINLSNKSDGKEIKKKKRFSLCSNSFKTSMSPFGGKSLRSLKRKSVS